MKSKGVDKTFFEMKTICFEQARKIVNCYWKKFNLKR